MEREEHVILADGTVLKGSCGFSGTSLWCWISEASMADCFALFSDPEKTREISVIYTSSGMKYTGFTDMIEIKKGTDMYGNPTVNVRMTWPEGGEHSIEDIVVQKNEGAEE